MYTLTASYSPEELAWITPEVQFKRDIYLIVTLKRPGKLIIRQRVSDGSNPRVPIRRHKDMTSFMLRLTILPKTADLNDKSVTEKKLADGSITKDKIATGAITKDKLSDDILNGIAIERITEKEIEEIVGEKGDIQ